MLLAWHFSVLLLPNMNNFKNSIFLLTHVQQWQQYNPEMQIKQCLWVPGWVTTLLNEEHPNKGCEPLP